MSEPRTHVDLVPESRMTRLGGLDAHFLQWGEPGRPAVVLLHGLRSYAATWSRLAGELARDHQVLALDFRGRGRSQWDTRRRYFTEDYVADVEEWVAQLGLRAFVLVGHSMGGTVGYVYAARHPDEVTRLVVEDIGPGSSTATSGADRIGRELSNVPRSFADRAAVVTYWKTLRPGIDDDAVASRLENTVVEEPDGSWRWRLDMDGIAAARLTGDPARGIDLWRCLEQLTCPTLVVRGGGSDFLSAETCREMATRQPGLTWVELPGAGHYAHDDQPEQFVRHVAAFCRAGTRTSI
ncbi:alpha/beta hydrolase [Nocardioides hungaricus]